MRTCENCKKTFQDDMNYCPYCGTKYHDYKDDLKSAMDDLFDEKKPIYSHFQQQELLKEKKKDIFLNKVLILVVVMMIGTLLVGAIMIGEKFLPTQPGIIEDTNPTNPDETLDKDDINNDENDSNQDDIENPNDDNNDASQGDLIDVTNDEDGDFNIDKIKIKKEEGQIRIEVKCNSSISGKIFLRDNGSLNIGPIEIREGNNQFYFLVSGNTDYKLYFDADNGNDYEYLITKDMFEKE